jgi:hypothetical protein
MEERTLPLTEISVATHWGVDRTLLPVIAINEIISSHLENKTLQQRNFSSNVKFGFALNHSLCYSKYAAAQQSTTLLYC